MIALLSRGYRLLVRRPLVRITLQATVSLILIVILVRAAQGKLLESLRLLQPGTIALVLLLQLAAVVLNSRRWQLLLRHLGVREGLGNLTHLYLVGQFFSLFLPTSTGGDAVRIYEVSRRSRRPAQTVVATLQERLLGLGTAMFIGVAATVYYFHLLPASLRLWALALQTAGAIAVTLLLYPGPLWNLARRLWRRGGVTQPLRDLVARPLPARLIAALRPVAEAPSLRPWQLVALIALAVIAALMGIGTYRVVGDALHIEAGFVAFCLIVPLVWVVRMLPVSLNGIGVGEGAFVFLLSLFAVPQGKALALALAMLGLQTSVAVLGGLLLAGRQVRNLWGSRTEQAAVSGPLALADVPVAILAQTVVAAQQRTGQATPAVLTKVGGRPFIDHHLELLAGAGLRRMVICLGPLGERVQAHVGDGNQYGLEVSYIHEGNSLHGTVATLRRAVPQLGVVFWVVRGGVLPRMNHQEALDEFLRRGVLGLLAVAPGSGRQDGNNVAFREDGLLRYDRHSAHPEMTHRENGIALLRREALEHLPADHPDELGSLFACLAAEGELAGLDVGPASAAPSARPNRMWRAGSRQAA